MLQEQQGRDKRDSQHLTALRLVSGILPPSGVPRLVVRGAGGMNSFSLGTPHTQELKSRKRVHSAWYLGFAGFKRN